MPEIEAVEATSPRESNILESKKTASSTVISGFSMGLRTNAEAGT